MNKKVSTVLFILGGTVVNLLLMITFISGLIAAVYGIFNGLGVAKDSTLYIPFLIGAIFGGLVLAFLVYSRIMKYIQKKYDLEKHLEPLFKTKRWH